MDGGVGQQDHRTDTTISGDQALVDESVCAGIAEAERLRRNRCGPLVRRKTAPSQSSRPRMTCFDFDDETR